MAVARGDEPADLVLSGGHVLSVFTKEWLDVDVAVKDGHVVGLGRYEGREKLDVAGAYLVPGFVDAHMHIESSKLMVDEFARAVLAHGTTAVVADPHEIANVLGTDGLHWLLDCCDALPLDVFVMASSCVPASRFESPRRPFTPGDIESLLRRSRTIGIAEMMNFPGVIAGSPSELAKLETGLTDHVDGHAPGVRGPALNAYISAGLSTDHEAFTLQEALENRRLGMWVPLREASSARNPRDRLPGGHPGPRGPEDFPASLGVEAGRGAEVREARGARVGAADGQPRTRRRELVPRPQRPEEHPRDAGHPRPAHHRRRDRGA